MSSLTHPPSRHYPQPRHFHAGATPMLGQLAYDQNQHASSDKAAAVKFEIAADPLRYAFSFLTLSELVHTAARVSKSWYNDAVNSNPPQNHCLDVDESSARTFLLIQSPFRRHASNFICWAHPLTEIELHALSVSMPHLEHLFCRLNIGTVYAKKSFPTQLRTLNIGFSAFHTPTSNVEVDRIWQHMRMIVEDFVRCCPSLQHILFEQLQYAEVPSDSNSDEETQLLIENSYKAPVRIYEPLIQLSQLVSCKFMDEPILNNNGEELMHFIRSMPTLTRFDLSNFRSVSDSSLNALSCEPHALKLTSVRPRDVTSINAAYLARIPSLTQLWPSQFNLIDASFIAHMVNLTDVRMNCTSIVDCAILAAALTHCKLITDFTFGHPTVTSPQLTLILTPLINLKSLVLHDLPLLSDLKFASSLPHLASTLYELYIGSCSSLGAGGSNYSLPIRKLTALNYLDIGDGVIRLNATTIATMTPGDEEFIVQLWPHLKNSSFS